LAAVTFIYCRPTALDTETGRATVDEALAMLASELGLDEGVRLREQRGNSIVVRGFEPRELWQAMDRAVPDWEDRQLFFAPAFF
jgi:hypothetical protein